MYSWNPAAPAFAADLWVHRVNTSAPQRLSRVTVHTPAGLCPVIRFAMHTNRQKMRFGAAALGFSATSAALPLTKNTSHWLMCEQ